MDLRRWFRVSGLGVTKLFRVSGLGVTKFSISGLRVRVCMWGLGVIGFVESRIRVRSKDA